ncbi:conserved hypothetical protein [Nitrospina gracilis 3/211]|uniref:Uncharacterized protein n=1 Tax=Nitrospina gracilis (strain 3/211) TaxID=1266370 RepID=M1Z9B3_NITG3|nr:conserved hypothetical protein [Nitrospina gracilis 3/211]
MFVACRSSKKAEGKSPLTPFGEKGELISPSPFSRGGLGGVTNDRFRFLSHSRKVLHN